MSIGFDENVLDLAKAQEMHSNMAEVVDAIICRLVNEQRKGMDIDLEALKFCQMWMRDNKVKPLTKDEQLAALSEEHEQSNRELLAEIKATQAIRALATRGAASDTVRMIKSNTVSDERLAELHSRMSRAEEDELKAEWIAAKKIRHELKGAAEMLDMTHAEYLKTLPVKVQVDAKEHLDLYRQYKDKFK
ncbi:hypothetical protein [Vibrio alginolyticus]|uniref:hypothetical protein n=1 Tax=Vibrio alginolyticus TaxID=663 RepID=UPI0010494D69|nr:hypothetical protein [Vibrio alginolyticus]TDE52090.1 hypothetical protein E1093_02780 [Vibrio alginolyticus]